MLEIVVEGGAASGNVVPFSKSKLRVGNLPRHEVTVPELDADQSLVLETSGDRLAIHSKMHGVQVGSRSIAMGEDLECDLETRILFPQGVTIYVREEAKPRFGSLKPEEQTGAKGAGQRPELPKEENKQKTDIVSYLVTGIAVVATIAIALSGQQGEATITNLDLGGDIASVLEALQPDYTGVLKNDLAPEKIADVRLALQKAYRYSTAKDQANAQVNLKHAVWLVHYNGRKVEPIEPDSVSAHLQRLIAVKR